MEPDWLSDSPAGIRSARRMTPRGHVCLKDINVQSLLDDDACTHWGNPEAGGWLYLQINNLTGKRRPLTHEERITPYHNWHGPKVKKLRRTAKRGTSYESRVRIHLFSETVGICKNYNVFPCFELKSPHYANATWVKRLIDQVYAKKWHAFYMALWKMGHCLEKGHAVISSTGQFAILAHGEKRPDGLIKGYNFTEIWGHFVL
jgi:hypothetical protein